MKAAGTTGTLGPNLDESKLSRTAIENVITSGKDAMPPYKKTLTAKQIDDVSEFVFQKRTGRRRATSRAVRASSRCAATSAPP